MQHYRAIGMLEFSSISAGIESADAMLKAADVEVIFLKTICPGKFIVAVHGDVGAVQASVAAGRVEAPTNVVDEFVIPNVHPSVIAALSSCVPVEGPSSLGVIETFSVAAAILAADAAVKAANVNLIEVRTALGLGGKGYVLMTGDVGAVEAALAAGKESAALSGLLVGSTLLPRPDAALLQNLI